MAKKQIVKVKTLIVDDHQMIRDGIRTMLESNIKNFKFIVTESDSGKDAIDKVQSNDYDIILMDYQLPKLNGAETIYQLLLYKPKLKILALSGFDEYSYINNMMESGAKGYVLKNIGPTELVTAIEAILNGKFYYSSDIATKLIHTKEIKSNISPSTLSSRELELIKLIAIEKSNMEIAEILNISTRTVETHRHNILNKLGVKNTVGIIKYAIEENLFK